MARKRSAAKTRPPLVAPSPPVVLASAPAPQSPHLPSIRKLVHGSLIALAVAIVILVVAVLPAEYGIDPTGIGERLGIRGMSGKRPNPRPEPGFSLGADPFASEATPVWRQPTPFRSDEISLTLQANQGAEIKARMRGGERYVFAWDVAGGKVDFDMHGEQANGPPDAFTSYWKGRDQQSGNGAFIAPFDGTHGWYWKNRGDAPVTVRVKTSGYYEKLYRPSAPAAQAKAESK